MTNERFWMVVFGGLGGLGSFGAVLLLVDSDIGAASKVATCLVGVAATALLWQRLKGGAATVVLSVGGMVFVALRGGAIVRLLVGLVALAVAAMVLTRNRPVRVSYRSKHTLRLPPEAAFDAVMMPSAAASPIIVEVRDHVRLPNGGGSYRLVCQKGSFTWTQHHIDTEFDRPHRSACEVTVHRSDVAEDRRSYSTRFEPARGGTRVTTTVETQLSAGGLFARLWLKLLGPRDHRRFLRTVEAHARSAVPRTGERVADPEAGPYLQPDEGASDVERPPHPHKGA